MVKEKLCCDNMERAINKEFIEKYSSYFIHKPLLVPDGDGLYDDMGDDMELDYCPFCGRYLK